MKKKFPIKKLGSIAKITMGQSPQSKFYNQENMGIPLIQGNADLKNGVTSPRIYTTSVTKKVKVGDIIMSVRAPVGELAISSHEACIGRGVCSIQAKNEQNLFLYYLLQHYRGNITKYSQGSTFDSINSSDIQKVEVPYPTTEEQQKIASILSTWDEVIDLYLELLSNKRKYFQGLLEHFLSEDKHWNLFKLGDVLKVQGGYMFKSSEYKDEGVPIVRISNIQDRIDLAKDVVYSGCTTLDNKYILKNGDILIAMSGATTGKIAMYRCGFPAYLNQRVGKFIVDNTLLNESFLFYYLHSSHFKNNLSTFLVAGAQPNISAKDIENIVINIPSLKEQESIAKILEVHEKEMSLIETMIDQLQEQKRGLMQLLLTGKVRV